jgi:hypothetical protein
MTAAEWIKEQEENEAEKYSVTHAGYELGIQNVEIVSASRKAQGYLKDKVRYTVRNKHGKTWEAFDLIVFDEETDCLVDTRWYFETVLGKTISLID